MPKSPVFSTLCRAAAAALLLGYTAAAWSSNPIKSSSDAVKFVLDSSAIDFTDNVRLVSLWERMKDSPSWTITLREANWVYRIQLSDSGELKVADKKDDPKHNNVEFWAAQPHPLEIPVASTYVDKAAKVLKSFNPSFTANQSAYESIFSVCVPARAGTKSRHATGCHLPNASNLTWNVRVLVDLPDDRWTVKEVVFDRERAKEIRQVKYYGKWRY